MKLYKDSAVAVEILDGWLIVGVVVKRGHRAGLVSKERVRSSIEQAHSTLVVIVEVEDADVT